MFTNLSHLVNAVCISSALVLMGCKEAPLSGTDLFEGENPNPASSNGSSSSSSSSSNGTGESGEIRSAYDTSSEENGIIPLEDTLFCGSTGQIVLKPNQSTTLSWRLESDYELREPLVMHLETESAATGLGILTSTGILTALYTAPSDYDEEFTVKVIAHTSRDTEESVCSIRLIPESELGVIDDGVSRGLVGNVYDFGTTVSYLPNLSLLTPVQEILVPNLDVPTRSFSQGFPGVRDLIEWFGVQFNGKITIPVDGTYRFKVYSDDGANLYIDNELVVDNDGVHAPAARTTEREFLAGTYPFRVDYFQGPRYHITMQLSWDTPETDGFEIVPPDAFSRPD